MVSLHFLYDPRSIFIYGNYAYIASASDNALEIVDVTDPAIPFHTGSLRNGSGGALLNDPYSVFVSGKYSVPGEFEGAMHSRLLILERSPLPT